MSTPILATKLFIPAARPELVPRPRLIERLNESLHRKLTLLAAPAGFGKTTVLSEWIPTSPRCVTWLSLDEGDKDPNRFWAYFISSLQRLRPDLGEAALSLLQSPQAPSIQSILTTLINDLATFPDTFAVVLDDYHVLDSKPIDQALTFLLKHLPPQMHLVIATREDPNLPLARLRARDQLNELRAADLRFTPDEATIFLNQVMGLSLSAEDITTLKTRTEGWIVGLQLAALSMQDRDDVSGFIQAFAGDNRYIVDYLAEEVLERQPEHVRNFLFRTSILERLSGALCDELSDQQGGQSMLETLERGNLFVVPLDEQRQWYRYHHLFAEVLRAHLMEEQPDQVPSLHCRASEWYARNDLLSDAIRHSLAAGDFELAAEQVEMAWPRMDRRRQTATWLAWAQALPDELVRARPVLSAGYAWALLDRGMLEAGDARLQDAEWWLDNQADGLRLPEMPPAEMVVVDKEEYRSLPATIAAARAYLALALGDVAGTVKHARWALEHLPKEDHLRRGTPAALLALASWASGDLQAADRSFTDAMTSFQTAGNILFAITGAYAQAEIKTSLGHLRQVDDLFQQTLQLAAERGKSVLWGTADLHTGWAELLREQNELAAAAEHLSRSKQLGKQAALPRWHFRWCIAQARLKMSQGDPEKALDLLDEAERRYVRGPVPDVHPIPALKARGWLAQGRLAEAQGWVRKQDLSPGDELSYLREFEHITLARLLIAQYRLGREACAIQDAMQLLARLLEAAVAGGRTGSVIEILVVQALAYQAQGDIPSALECLARALALAEPEGYVRIFADEGVPIAHLLSAATAHGMLPDYAAKLLATMQAARKGEEMASVPSIRPRLDAQVQPAGDLPVEALSPRELEVLRLVAQGLSNQEISDRLFLALSTVKGYNRTIFSKLQVHRRTEAIVRARELGLL